MEISGPASKSPKLEFYAIYVSIWAAKNAETKGATISHHATAFLSWRMKKIAANQLDQCGADL